MRAAGLILAASIAAGSPAAAQTVMSGCYATDEMRQALAGLGEFPVMLGITTDGRLFEVYASPAGAFSVVLTDPAGVSCLTTFGDGLLNALPALQGEPQAEGDPA